MGGYVVEHRLIAKNYLTGWFIIDFVSILPFDTLGMVMQSDDIPSVTHAGSPAYMVRPLSLL